MKYAWYPGCVSQGACPELFKATLAVADKLGIELVELKEAACTGAGILSERNPELSDTLNARTFAMAERLGLPLMTICSTCQGVMSQANYKLQNDPEYLAKVNETLALEGLEYKGTTKVSHLLWVIVEDVGLDKVEPLVERPLTGIKIAPFYGCYILRPTMYLGFEDQPERDTYIEKITTTLGGIAVDYSGKTKCCGFPILTMNEKASYAMAGDHLIEAKQEGADVMVTPCPLCHLPGRCPAQGSQTEEDANRPPHHPPPPDDRLGLRHPPQEARPKPPHRQHQELRRQSPRLAPPRHAQRTFDPATIEGHQPGRSHRGQRDPHPQHVIDPLLRALGWDDPDPRYLVRRKSSNTAWRTMRSPAGSAREPHRMKRDLTDRTATNVLDKGGSVRQFGLTNGDRWEFYLNRALVRNSSSHPQAVRIGLRRPAFQPFPDVEQPKRCKESKARRRANPIPRAPEIPSIPSSRLANNVDVPKVPWLGALIAFGIFGWISGVWTAQPIEGSAIPVAIDPSCGVGSALLSFSWASSLGG